MFNVVALRGVLSRTPDERILEPSGDRLTGLQVTVRRAEARRAETVPVVWRNPPPSAGPFTAGDEVVVVGRVARRFFQTGGRTGSRTEVVAEVVVPARQRRRAAAALDRALAELEQLPR